MAGKVDSGDKETYLTQIRYLDKQLERCQLNYDELEQQNKDLVSQHSALQKDKKDITEHLKRSVVAKEKKMDELPEQLERQQQAALQDREALKLQHSQQMQQLQEQIDNLSSENLTQVAKFEEQRKQKEQLMLQLSDMESLKKQKEKHEAAIHSLKKEAELEMNRLLEKTQNTVDPCVKMDAANVLQKERAEHRERLEQLWFLQNETVALQKENNALCDSERDLEVKVDDLKNDLNKITQETLTLKQELEDLARKCQQLEVELKEWRIIHQRMLATEEDLGLCLASVIEECQQITAETFQLRAELQREKSRRRQLDGVMQEAVIILRNILEDSEKGFDTRKKMQRLLEIVESPAPQGTGSALSAETSDPQTTLALESLSSGP